MRPTNYFTKKDMEAAGVGLDRVVETGRFLRSLNEIESRETRDALKRPGEPQIAPSSSGVVGVANYG
jgi:hypothetical protein